MYKHFFDIQSETVRDITPARYANFRTIFSMVNDSVENIDLNDADKTFDNLLKQYQHGELDAKAEKFVEEKMEQILEQFETLTKKKKVTKLTDGEQMQYDLYKKWSNMWE